MNALDSGIRRDDSCEGKKGPDTIRAFFILVVGRGRFERPTA